ncbi:MAG: DNA adenine methylase [Candidatus Loosdrechtia sp.]|uniref:DNA adenine methylase n=1 Tax=Candidatus Loosdrechtia sp. TaxID=3101272 RepID=UPI003A64B875|nr:MAG: DNA adenine methylase [Candidatus Jettenia sp. AMX2]
MLNIHSEQLVLLKNREKFPSTRFQGSKFKIADWIWEGIKDLKFQTALDAFGGTGSIAYMLKQKGKTVTYNDILKFNYHIGLALIENDTTVLSKEDILFLLTKHKGIVYPAFVTETFKDIYYTDEENRWIDMVAVNIVLLDDSYKQSMAYFALFQACIAKRPFNLFHRRNLYLRFADIKRDFGNKAMWDASFEVLFKRFAEEANCAVFCNEQRNRALNLDSFDVKGDFDLVYIDTPYISGRGIGIDYPGFYHFLEGLVHYSTWPDMIDYRSKHKKLRTRPLVWTDKNKIHAAFDQLFERFRDSIIVVSYRSDGTPSIRELTGIIRKYKRRIHEIKRKCYQYVLSKRETEEVLLVGE